MLHFFSRGGKNNVIIKKTVKKRKMISHTYFFFVFDERSKIKAEIVNHINIMVFDNTEVDR
jgi:hypothetical protein